MQLWVLPEQQPIVKKLAFRGQIRNVAGGFNQRLTTLGACLCVSTSPCCLPRALRVRTGLSLHSASSPSALVVSLGTCAWLSLSSKKGSVLHGYETAECFVYGLALQQLAEQKARYTYIKHMSRKSNCVVAAFKPHSFA